MNEVESIKTGGIRVCEEATHMKAAATPHQPGSSPPDVSILVPNDGLYSEQTLHQHATIMSKANLEIDDNVGATQLDVTVNIYPI